MTLLPRYTPFPSPYRIGTDICQVSRILKILRSERRFRFAKMVLKRSEVKERSIRPVLHNWTYANFELFRASAKRRTGMKMWEETMEKLGMRKKEVEDLRTFMLKGDARRRAFLSKHRGAIRLVGEEEFQNAGQVQESSKNDLEREDLLAINKEPQESKSEKVTEEDKEVAEKSDGIATWLSNVKSIFGAKKGPQEEGRKAERDLEQGTEAVELGADVPGNKKRSEDLQKKSDMAKHIEDEARNDLDLLRAALECRKTWMTERGYEGYEDENKTPIQNQGDRVWITATMKEVADQWRQDNRNMPSEGKEDWIQQKLLQKREKYRILRKVAKHIRLSLPIPSEDGGVIDSISGEIKDGAIGDQGTVDAGRIASQQPTTTHDIPAMTTDPESIFSDESAPPTSERNPFSGVGDNSVLEGRDIDGEESTTEQKESALSLPNTTQNLAESTESSISSSSNSSSSQVSNRVAELTQQNEVDPEDLDLAREKSQPLTIYRELYPRGMQKPSRSEANILALMGREGIYVHPWEVAALAEELEMLDDWGGYGKRGYRHTNANSSSKQVGDEYFKKFPTFRTVSIKSEPERTNGVPPQIGDEPPKQEDGIPHDVVEENNFEHLREVISDDSNQETSEEMRDRLLEYTDEMTSEEINEIQAGTPEKSLEELGRDLEAADIELRKVAQWLAGRFAAKEAIIKAHQSRRLTFHDILILKPEQKEGETRSFAPVAVVLPERWNGEEGEALPKEVRISISHDGDYATAMCLAVDE
ncbi:hypothetical protein ONS95_014432 [Cadophora gregata]|uniref:uncharacterized protein n=1 Tax=Cadophora gregata TaxID=51156 RepID=UPI0026DA6F40|nr:uncharacterized protein ONS95_014432 [Cadophora gregata]KAK0112694.1 hypothetical protein ONS95_014432 [Cadophora gregata]KAK0124827.1 hypothetical protein ONS96_008708 [Cadophora gregata f. sp. sojae]